MPMQENTVSFSGHYTKANSVLKRHNLFYRYTSASSHGTKLWTNFPLEAAKSRRKLTKRKTRIRFVDSATSFELYFERYDELANWTSKPQCDVVATIMFAPIYGWPLKRTYTFHSCVFLLTIILLYSLEIEKSIDNKSIATFIILSTHKILWRKFAFRALMVF